MTAKVPLNAKTPCQRCGLDCVPDFCRDCQEEDPQFCEGGRSKLEIQAERRARNEVLDDFWATIRALGGSPKLADRRRHERSMGRA